MAIPDIPGSSLDAAYEREKIRQVANLMKVKHHRFPGAQPISFSNEHFSELENENYFVSEKADGIRCLLFVCKNIENKMEAFLIDRKNKYKYVGNLWFPEPNDNTFRKFHDNTIIDGELVLDELENGETKLRFLIFDLVVYNGEYLAGREYSKRLGYLTNYILNPYKKYLQYNPEYAKNVPFSVELKKLHLSYRMNDVFEEQKLLKHKSDGLIFTSESSPYISGNCNKMLKWKPIRENSIDFKVHYIKEEHRFTLNIWGGEKNHFYYADLTIDNPEMQEEWEKNPPEGKIIECYFENNCWHFMRFREDKENANHESIVKKIIKSIEDNVEKDELLEHTQIIRNNWKQREIDKKRGIHHQAPPQQQQQRIPVQQSSHNRPPHANNMNHQPPHQNPTVNSKDQEKYRSNIYSEMLSNEYGDRISNSNNENNGNSDKRKRNHDSDEESFSSNDEREVKKSKY
ncbi:hypothetical protein LY90DRAFT_393506 [Neocallimastix californiae]|jgi:mRNA guanylyltransferase|uniref:mRNA guanylyltransferase n=1 Tax=Neocallimastix californiae TaxID=1754190 RepID=A0A1Y1YHS1_9FUNG|nr:hypothetical protein LY90DRAFT_393506 [Neocallimastix californiae]|eukprot:ORX97164.1 hypothetical protein LY90DRAFT_393506 [Neocallimastix californiae]